MTRDDPTTKPTDAGRHGARDDVESDPAESSDWSGEGGATPAGASTDTDN